MRNTIFRYITVFLLCIFTLSPIATAKEFNLFDGILKIRVDDNTENNRDQQKRSGHYEIINGKVVWVEDRPKHDRHIIDDDHEKWVLLTRIRNEDYDWVIVPEYEGARIRRYIERGYYHSMTSGKRHCYRTGKKKERLWRENFQYWL